MRGVSAVFIALQAVGYGAWRKHVSIIMKNIQIIDGAQNCVYDIFSATDEEFLFLFPAGVDIAFIDEIYTDSDSELLDAIFNKIWQRRIKKSEVQGIHGVIFYGLNEKMIYYPARKDEEAINPDGSKLR